MGMGTGPVVVLCIDNQVSLTTVNTTVGDKPMTTPLYLADIGGYLRRVLFQVTQAGDSFGIVLTTLVFFYI